MTSPIFASTDLISFIKENINKNPADIIMSFSQDKFPFDLKFAAMQISCRDRTRKKLPYFLSYPEFLFPDSISAEQATDERVARFHASLIGSGKRVVDLTSGLGIDAMTIAMNGNEMTAIEMDSLKAETLKHNFPLFNIKEFNVICADCNNYLESMQNYPDVFFIDPARRDASKKRTYALSDCLPDVTMIYHKLIAHGSDLFIKSSPLLDITSILKELEKIVAIFIISVKNECKEVLIHIKDTPDNKAKLYALDLDDKGIKSQFSFYPDENKSFLRSPIVKIEEIKEGGYLYEPNAALMKLNAGVEICRRFRDIVKISSNTELFFSNTYIKDFPGRIIKINRILSSKLLKTLQGEGYSIVARNYPLAAEQIRKKNGIKESSENFIYAFRAGISEKPMIIEGKRMDAD